MNNRLTAPENSDLRRLEAVIEKGKQTFIDIGNALRQIRDQELYREKWTTFESYCEDRWEFKKSQAYRLIDASIVQEKLETSPMGDKLLVKNERQARELAKVPEEDWQEVLDDVAETQQATGKPATAKDFKESAQKVATKKSPVPAYDDSDYEDVGDIDDYEEPSKKLPKSGAETLSPAKIIDEFYRLHYPPLVRGIDAAANAIGHKGPNYAAADAALNAFSEAVKLMREGNA
jgi:hypothetical protein